jgi:hypothetical protein
LTCSSRGSTSDGPGLIRHSKSTMWMRSVIDGSDHSFWFRDLVNWELTMWTSSVSDGYGSVRGSGFRKNCRNWATVTRCYSRWECGWGRGAGCLARMCSREFGFERGQVRYVLCTTVV